MSSHVPPAYHALVDVAEGLAACPHCSNVFRRSYDSEWDLGLYETWALQRLSPTEATAQLDGDLGVWWADNYDKQIGSYQRGLSHPQVRIREDAGWALAHHYLAERDWSGLRALLHDADRDAARVAAEVVDNANLGGVDVPRTLFGGPGDNLAPLVRVRVRAGLRDDPSAVVAALCRPDNTTLSAALSEVDRAHRAGPVGDEVLEAALQHASHPDDDVRRVALWILGRLEGPEQSARVLAISLELMNADAPRVREDGCRVLVGVAAVPEAAEAIPRLVELLADQGTRWSANRALQALANAGADLSSAVAPVLARLASDPWEIDLELVGLLIAAGHDMSAAAETIASLTWSGVSARQALACQLLERLIDGDVLSPDALDDVQTRLPTLSGYQTEKLSTVVAQSRLRVGDWANIRALLALSTTAAWGTIDALMEAATHGVDVAECVEAVEAVMMSNPGSVASHAKKLLTEVARRTEATPPDEFDQRLREFYAELAASEDWDSEFTPNPHSPHRALSRLVELGPVVVPSLCLMVRDGMRAERYWGIVGLIEIGPTARDEGLAVLEPLLGLPAEGAHAAEAIGVIDEDRFFELGLVIHPGAVRALTRHHTRAGTIAPWLRRVLALELEESAAALVGLEELDPSNAALVEIVRDALGSPVAEVRDRAVRLLGRAPGIVPASALIEAMVGGIAAPIEAVAFHPDSIDLIPGLLAREHVSFLAALLQRRRCAGHSTSPELVRAFIEQKLRHPDRPWRYEEHDVHDAALCALELGDERLLPALVDAVSPQNSGYAWRPLVQALAFFADQATALLQAKRSTADPAVDERIGWMIDQIATARRPEISWADRSFVEGSIDHTTGGAFAAYAAVLREGPSAHAAFQLAWIDRAFGVPITTERAAWIESLGCTDVALLNELCAPVSPLTGLRLVNWRSCKMSQVNQVLEAGLPGLAWTGSRDPGHRAAAEAHVARVATACA